MLIHIDIVEQIRITIYRMITKQPLISKWTNPCAQWNVVVFKIRAAVPRMKRSYPSGAEKRKKLNNGGKG